MRLLLLPGMDGTGVLFEPLLKALPASLAADVVVFPGDRELGYDELLGIVLAAAPKTEPFVVVAESFSGPLAVMLAARQPAGLRGVVLSASFAGRPVPAWITWLRGLSRGWLMRLAPMPVTRWFLMGRHRTPQLDRLLSEALQRVRPHVLAARARAALVIDARHALRSFHRPLLYLQATDDRLIRPHCLAAITRERPTVEVKRIHAPHMLLQAAPREAAEAIDRFIRERCAPA